MKIQFLNRGVRREFFISMLAVFLFAAVAGAQPTNFADSLAGLRTQLDALLDQPRFNGALWSVKVAALDTGKVVYENHADRLMSPASNSKLYTAALALFTFGGDYRFATPVQATAKVEPNGTLPGDVIVSGRGDPSWKAAHFWDNFTPFVTIITNAGVRRITGDLVMDTTFFKGPPTGGSWAVDDLEYSYGAFISALTLEDNTAQIRVTPAANVSAPCSLALSPSETGIVLINRTKTIPAGGRSNLQTHRPLGTSTTYVFGELPAGGTAETLDVPVPRPAAWFGATLKIALERAGVIVNGQVRCVEWPEVPSWSPTNLVELGEVQSPPLREILHAFLKPSQNLETDLVFDHIGESLRPADAPAMKTSEECAVTVLKNFLAANRIPAEVHFDEGSGLSRNNLTSANATVALLELMAKNRWVADYENALPVAGVDGTLRRRMKNTPAFNNVRAKTGTLRWANSLSGYVTTAAGDKLAFSLMLNRYASPPERRRTAELDDIAVMLAGYKGGLKE